MMKKISFIIATICLVAILSWFLGPKVVYPDFNNLPASQRWEISSLDSVIFAKESLIKNIKEDNQARIIWADSIPRKTEYSIVYIHGYSASQGEGDPIHTKLAQELHANLYLTRLRDHGINDRDAFKYLTPDQWVDDAKESIAIGKSIGDKVIVMSCSTGGTLSVYLAANDPELYALILLSPNISIYDTNAKMLTGPWGESIAHRIIGEYREVPIERTHPYWSGTYHINGLIALQSLIDRTMTDEIFSKITIPVFMGYYYKNEEEQDKVVSVKAMKDFYNKISTPIELKEEHSFQNAGNHVISSKYKNDNWQEVYNSVSEWVKGLEK